MLHGFPESHRTWRLVAPLLAERFHLIMPDQRGFGASDRPAEVSAYAPHRLTADLFALANALELERFALVGHDWGGAIAWTAALTNHPRLAKLAIVNAPHPWLFQKALIDDPEQRAASQYMNVFRSPAIERMIAANGFDWFFERTFSAHVELSIIPPEERARYIADWSRPGALTAMLNWYRATGLAVPEPGEKMDLPAWMAQVPKVHVPTLVIWGMLDPAILPGQLIGLEDWVDDLTIERLRDAGHFAPWQAPGEVAAAIADFL
ncbi:MAG: alpha/beta fold hydrolase [Sphingomonas sp.]|nr:alpha/beta fold hydrolase [Sphingomonas sp.]